jgi:hypothetical protein
MPSFDLTPEQQRTLDRTGVEQKPLDGELHPRDAYAAIDRTFAEGWNDPKMDDYDRYETLKR